MKQWIKFFGLSFFSDCVSDEAPRRGYRNLFLALFLAFLLFFAGFLCAGVVPFSSHYERAGKFRQFVDAAFSEGGASQRIALTVENGYIKASADSGSPSEKKIINTYTDASAAELYSLNGYNLIVDTRPAATPVVFTQVGVSDSGEKISYEQYRSLAEQERRNYTVKTEYTDEELAVDEEAAARFEEFLENNEEAAESYRALQEEKNSLATDAYRMRLYALYVRNYYQNAASVTTLSDVPALRDYYYLNYVLEYKTDNLFIFGDIVYGSFITDGGVSVSFGGRVSEIPDGAITDVGELIKAVFYKSVNYTVTTYFLNTMLQLPLIALIPLIIALLVWSAGKIWKCDSLKTFGGCVKTVGAFVWFSAFITGLAAFALGFFVGGTTVYSLMLPIYAAVLSVRSAIYTIKKIVKNRRET